MKWLVPCWLPCFGRSRHRSRGGGAGALALFPIELLDTSLQGEVQGVDPADAPRLH